MMKQLRMLLVLILCLLPGLALAADDGNTYPRLEELTTETSTVSAYSLRNTGAETVAQAIAAGKIPKADKSRLKATLPTGMAGTVTSDDGLITVTVDLKNSNWQTVLTTLTSFPHVNFRHTLDRPTADYEHHVGFGGNGVPDEPYERVLYLMQQDIPAWGEGNNTQSGNGERTCEIIPTQALAQAARDDESTHVIAWIDWYTDENGAQQQKVYYEYYKVRVTVKDVDAFHIPFRYVTESALKATESISQPSGVTIKSISDGDITFRTDSSFTSSADVTVAINAPSKASYMKITSPENMSRTNYTVSGGKVSFKYQVHPNSNSEEQFTIAWYNSSHEVVDYGLFMFHCEPSTYAPWPTYEDNWHAVPSSRVELTNLAVGAGVTFEYTDYTSAGDNYGVVHTDYDPNAEITGNVGGCTVRVKAPDGIEYYRTNHSGGNNIMGESQHRAKQQVDYTGSEDLQKVPDNRWIEILYTEPVRTIYAGPLEIYLQTGEGDAWPYSGGITSIFWYKDEAQANANNGKSPERIEYVADTQGALCVTNRVPVVEKEEDIKKPVKDVTCVGSDAYAKGWRLVIRRYPYKGSDAFHYELTLENEYGAYQPLTQPMIFYMPYPNDFNSHSGYTYGLRHYDNEYDKYELVDVSLTNYGVRFVINSLSPFVLEWEDPNKPTPTPTPTPEPTPDDSGDHGGSGTGGNSYHLHHLDMQPGHMLTMDNVRVENVNAFYLGDSTVKDCYIHKLFIGYTAEDMGDISTNGIVLSRTGIGTLEFSLSTNATTPSFDQPFIRLGSGTTIDMLMVDSRLPALSTWLSYGSDVTITTVCIDGSTEMPFAAYLAMQEAQGGTK